MSYTHYSPELGCDLGKNGTIEHIVHVLKILFGEEQTDNVADRVYSLVGILHNAIMHGARSADNRPIYRKAGVHTHLEKWMDTPIVLLKVVVLLTMSYITNEEERDKLGKTNKAVEFLVEMLKEAVASKDHIVRARPSSTSFTATELLQGLNQLFINESNKEIMESNEGIPLITKMLGPGFNPDDQIIAAKALWNLAFHDDIRKSDAMKESITGN